MLVERNSQFFELPTLEANFNDSIGGMCTPFPCPDGIHARDYGKQATSVSENHPNLPLSVGSFPGFSGKSVDFGELSSVQNPYDFTLITLVDS